MEWAPEKYLSPIPSKSEIQFVDPNTSTEVKVVARSRLNIQFFDNSVEMGILRKVFSEQDTEGNGKISFDQLRYIYESLGLVSSKVSLSHSHINNPTLSKYNSLTMKLTLPSGILYFT